MKTYKITFSKSFEDRYTFRCNITKDFSIGKAVKVFDIKKFNDAQHFICNSIDLIENYKLNYEEFIKIISGFKKDYEKTINSMKHRKKNKLIHRDYEVDFVNKDQYEL